MRCSGGPRPLHPFQAEAGQAGIAQRCGTDRLQLSGAKREQVERFGDLAFDLEPHDVPEVASERVDATSQESIRRRLKRPRWSLMGPNRCPFARGALDRLRPCWPYGCLLRIFLRRQNSAVAQHAFAVEMPLVSDPPWMDGTPPTTVLLHLMLDIAVCSTSKPIV